MLRSELPGILTGVSANFCFFGGKLDGILRDRVAECEKRRSFGFRIAGVGKEGVSLKFEKFFESVCVFSEVVLLGDASDLRELSWKLCE